MLAKLRHPRIVRLEHRLTIAGRPCLLLSLAGQSLQRELAEHGTPSLDYASRYGSDLLNALAHLEDEDVLHRDIKPANMGVGAVSKKSQSLSLFDFSLAGIALTDVAVGTAAYRDPYLAQRGHWDAAADRYSAAVTLYELVTGQRPAVDAGGAVTLSAERFDPSVRAALVTFFASAFAADVASRHATAEAMRRDWERAFEAERSAGTAPDDEPVAVTLTDEQIAALAPTTPIQALPLSNRAKNALDRAGFLRVGELRDLPQNRLSVMRGVGRQVAKDILAFRDRWVALAPSAPPSSEPAFFPGYRGADLIVQVALPDVPASATAALVDAGFRNLSQLAAAAKARVIALAKRHGGDPATLAGALTREHAAAQARDQPTTIGAWIDALLPAKKKHQHARAMYGLDGTRYASVRELATALGVTTAAIYIAIGKSRTAWAAHPAIDDLIEEVHGVLDRAGGAMPLDAAGTELLTQIAHAEGDDPARAACALVRVVAELDKDQPDGIRFVRLAGDAPWLVRREDLEGPLKQLGAIADELAAREILAGPAEAQRALADIVARTPLAELAADRLVRLAAAASQHAAASSRLELYPRGMAAQRALELSAAIIPGRITEDKLRELVTARYPAAAPLPARPALDDLATGLELHYVQADAIYARVGAEGRGSLHTAMSSYTRVASLASRGPEIEARKVAIHEFDDQIRVCLERRALLVLGVSADRAADAELALTRRFGLQPQSFDALFLAELERQMATGRVQERLVYDTDARGIADQAWPNLLGLAKRTAKALATRLLPPKAPLLLTQPGLIDRYALDEFLRALVEAARTDEAEATFLLVPGHEGGVSRIGATLIPDLLPGQATWVPKAWIGMQLETAVATAR